jgi:hypothetical protein
MDFEYIWRKSAIFLFIIFFHSVCASPLINATGNIPSDRRASSVLTTRDAEEFTLRILPLGASITAGYLSSDNNGYRKALRAQLRHAGWAVNMVGSVSTGTMHDKVCVQLETFLFSIKLLHRI